MAQGVISYDDGTILRAPLLGNSPGYNGLPLTEIELHAFEKKVNIQYRDLIGNPTSAHFCTATMSGVPTNSPSKRITKRPSSKPTPKRPTRKPSKPKPTKKPSRRKTVRPSKKPSKRPSKKPTRIPSMRPTKKPTARQTKKPTKRPSRKPTKRPSSQKTKIPTIDPASSGSSCPVFPVDHVWNTPIDCLPVHSNSATYINTIGSSKGLHPDFGSGYYDGSPMGIPYISVSGSQAKYPVNCYYADESDVGPYAIPFDAPIEGGSSSTGDRHVLSVDKDNCILYELYNAYPHPDQQNWSAGSGVIFNLTGYSLRTRDWTSADAAGLPIYPGLLRYDEILSGEIRHALRFTVPQTQKAYLWPARHYASSLTGTQYPPMGLRFRLKASFDITSFSSTNRIILTALKKYGMIIADNGSSWFVSGTPDDRWDNDDLHNLQTFVKGR